MDTVYSAALSVHATLFWQWHAQRKWDRFYHAALFRLLIIALAILPVRFPVFHGYRRPYICNKKHLKNVGPIRHCEPPHAACFTLPFTRCRYGRTPPAHRCPQQHRQQRQRVTEGAAMAPWNGPNHAVTSWIRCAIQATTVTPDY